MSGGGRFFDNVMLIYRHWVIMARCQKLSDIIALVKCKVNYIKTNNIAFALYLPILCQGQ